MTNLVIIGAGFIMWFLADMASAAAERRSTLWMVLVPVRLAAIVVVAVGVFL